MKKKNHVVSLVFLVLFFAAVAVTGIIKQDRVSILTGFIVTAAIAAGIRKKARSRVIEDERNLKIREKSSRAAVMGFVLAAALPAYILVIMFPEKAVLSAIGYTLQACMGLILLIDIIAYYIYERAQTK